MKLPGRKISFRHGQISPEAPLDPSFVPQASHAPERWQTGSFSGPQSRSAARNFGAKGYELTYGPDGAKDFVVRLCFFWWFWIMNWSEAVGKETLFFSETGHTGHMLWLFQWGKKSSSGFGEIPIEEVVVTRQTKSRKQVPLGMVLCTVASI